MLAYTVFFDYKRRCVLLLKMINVTFSKITALFVTVLLLFIVVVGYIYCNDNHQPTQINHQEFIMTKIELYSKEVCPYCVRAKKLLTKKGASFAEIDISQNSELRDAMIKRANGRQTVPQIFINDQHIGGCDDLYALDAAGKLDALLADGHNA
jgi:glutaredoxin 3